VHLTLREGRLFLQTDPLGPNPLELFAESESQFFAAQGFSITLHRNAEQIVAKLTLHAGQVYEATKIL
jgi:hypothetical protein